MHTHVWSRRPGGAELSVSGPVDPGDIETLRREVRVLRGDAGIVVDLHRATLTDLILVQLATGLGAEGPVALVGLSQHQARLLRYHGLRLHGGRHRAEVPH